MEKRGRRRPKKTTPPNPNTLGETTMVRRDRKVSCSDDLPEFYKFYVPALWSERLRIPQDFVDKFGGTTPAIATLIRGASDISWQANMNKIKDDWFIEKGWPEFVKENSVEEGDFLTFAYAGNATFYVKVFAVNGCRKRVDDDDYDDIQESEVSEHAEIPENSRKLSPREASAVESVFRTNRSFSVVMKKSYVCKNWLHLPMEFWREYVEKNGSGSRRKRRVTLWVKTKSWNVSLLHDNRRSVFSQGWGKFAQDNSLQTGSSCTFRLINSSEALAFEVIVS